MKAMAAAALLALMGGCASAPESPGHGAQPTHYWQSSSDASPNRYRADNVACQNETGVDQGSTVFQPGSQAFDGYRDCMVSRGYVLRQY